MSTIGAHIDEIVVKTHINKSDPRWNVDPGVWARYNTKSYIIFTTRFLATSARVLRNIWKTKSVMARNKCVDKLFAREVRYRTDQRNFQTYSAINALLFKG